MKSIILAALAVATTLAVAPAWATDAPKAAKVEDKCLNPRLIDGFMQAKRNSVVLTQGSHRWLAETIGTCSGLDYANDIATVAKAICVGPGDSITFHEPSGMLQRCMIDTLTYMPKEAKAVSN
jgi:hypothetical protein